MASTAAREPQITPSRLASTIMRTSSSECSHAFSVRSTPALFTHTSTRPALAAACATARCDAGSRTSCAIAHARSPIASAVVLRAGLVHVGHEHVVAAPRPAGSRSRGPCRAPPRLPPPSPLRREVTFAERARRATVARADVVAATRAARARPPARARGRAIRFPYAVAQAQHSHPLAAPHAARRPSPPRRAGVAASAP